MSLHVSEPQFHHEARRMRPTWTCDVIETETGKVVETTHHQSSPEQAQGAAQKLIERAIAQAEGRAAAK